MSAIEKHHQTLNVLILTYLAACFFLFLYSFTQIDLNLTLSRLTILQSIQKSFQYVGYYQRPFSTLLYVGVLGMLFISYWGILQFLSKHPVPVRQVFVYVLVLVGILILSYPAFSYDMFNYLFTAKTVVLYHKNPYGVIPLDFSGVDPWLSFMRWTHLPSAYTPLWIALTMPAYLFGFGSVLLTLWNIKVIVAISFLVTTWLIGKILTILDRERAALGMAIFALNPLVVVETLVSAHNDMIMMAFAMGAFYLYLRRRLWLSYLVWSFSVAAKLMTLVLLPMYLLGWKRTHALIAMAAGFVLVLFQREVLPWYFIWLAPFVALLPRNKRLHIVAVGVSLGLLLRYTPYLYFGNWNDPGPMWKFWGTVIPIAISLFVAGRVRSQSSST